MSATVKEVELEILLTVTEILNRHDIYPFLAYGTLLGAARHGGFIPWDDDIDVHLFREDYENAREILCRELPPEYRYCDRHTEKDYPYCFAKVRKNGTAFVQEVDMHLNIHKGVWIDLMPLDAAPEDEAEYERFVKRSKALKKQLSLATMSIRKGGKLRPLWQVLMISASHIFLNRKKIQRRLDAHISSHKNEESVYLCDNLNYYKRLRRDWFGKGTYLDFEGKKLLCPAKYEDYLAEIYGDWRTPPPPEKRASHHGVAYISLDSEYHPNKQ